MLEASRVKGFENISTASPCPAKEIKPSSPVVSERGTPVIDQLPGVPDIFISPFKNPALSKA